MTSPANHFSSLVGADLQIHPHRSLTFPIESEHEHAVLILSGDCALEKQPLTPGVLYYLGTQRTELTFASTDGARVLLIGGLPFPETILMWWNFVAERLRKFGPRERIGKCIGDSAMFRPIKDHA